MIEAKWKTIYAGGAHDIGESDIAELEGKIIIKSSTMPTASADTLGEVRQYVGATAGDYTHGYIYECVAGDTIYTGTVTFQPATLSGTVVACDGDTFANFVATGGDDPEAVVSGTMTYHYASSIWVLSGLDADGNEIAHRQIYQPDYEDVGFTFTGTPADGDVVTFECTVTEDHTEYSWARIDVQPDATRGRFLSLWDCATGLPLSNPASSPYEYATGDYFIVSNVGATNYKPNGSSYTTGVASTTVETVDVKVDDTYYFDGTNWRLQQNVSPVGYEMTANKVTSLSAQSTDTQYPSAKCVYDAIPTVNDATLTIQKNGTSVATFSANASSNATANITVPTDTSDLTNGAGYITSSAISSMQTTTNLVTSVSAQSTDTQYPSAKCVYDIVGDIETLLQGV